MPISVQKPVIDGADIIKVQSLSIIGPFSEEVLEFRRKNVKYYRKYHIRKCSRDVGIKDIMNLFIFSDPRISVMRRFPSKNALFCRI